MYFKKCIASPSSCILSLVVRSRPRQVKCWIEVVIMKNSSTKQDRRWWWWSTDYRRTLLLYAHSPCARQDFMVKDQVQLKTTPPPLESRTHIAFYKVSSSSAVLLSICLSTRLLCSSRLQLKHTPNTLYLHTICYSAKDGYQFPSSLVWYWVLNYSVFCTVCLLLLFQYNITCWNEWFHWILMMVLIPLLLLLPQHHPWRTTLE